MPLLMGDLFHTKRFRQTCFHFGGGGRSLRGGEGGGDGGRGWGRAFYWGGAPFIWGAGGGGPGLYLEVWPCSIYPVWTLLSVSVEAAVLASGNGVLQNQMKIILSYQKL